MASLTQETFMYALFAQLSSVIPAANSAHSAAQEAETQLLAALDSSELVSQDIGIYLAWYVALIENVGLS